MALIRTFPTPPTMLMATLCLIGRVCIAEAPLPWVTRLLCSGCPARLDLPPIKDEMRVCIAEAPLPWVPRLLCSGCRVRHHQTPIKDEITPLTDYIASIANDTVRYVVFGGRYEAATITNDSPSVAYYIASLADNTVRNIIIMDIMLFPGFRWDSLWIRLTRWRWRRGWGSLHLVITISKH